MKRNYNNIIHKIYRRFNKMRFGSIDVFVFHHVSDEHNQLLYGIEDWTQTEQFKKNIIALKNKYEFISLSEAVSHLKHDIFRFKRYAVLTSDDGSKSLLSILPWLENNQIPITLFINTRCLEKNYLKQIHINRLNSKFPNADINEILKQMYMSKQELFDLSSPLIEIGMHGHEHLDLTEMSIEKCKQEIDTCYNILKNHRNFINAFAFTWGKYTNESLLYLYNMKTIPLFVNNMRNYRYKNGINRICIDNMKL